MCLEKIGVIAGDSRLDDRERFFVFDILYHFFPPVYPDDFWYYINAYYPIHDVRGLYFFFQSKGHDSFFF